jgi:hypothetical protein
LPELTAITLVGEEASEKGLPAMPWSC